MEVAGVEIAVLPLGDVDAAGAAADDHADVVVGPEARVLERLARRQHGDARDLGVAFGIGAAVSAEILAVQRRFGKGDRVFADTSGDARCPVPFINTVERGDATFSREDGVPESHTAHTEGRHRADACDGNGRSRCGHVSL